MSFLYPRLLAGQARPLHEQYRSLTIQDLMKRADTSNESAVYVATGGDRIPEAMLQQLREQVVDLAKRTGFPSESNRGLRATFDLHLATLLHSEMVIVPAEAASSDVWAFLALVLLPDVAYWRYPRPPGDRVLGTDLTRHVFGRMWWRAQLVHSAEDPDPYAALKLLGEDAFDQIYTRRKALGGSPHLVKSILRVWNTLDLRGLTERDVQRNFLMRLLRLGPFILFEALDERSLDAELRIVVRETVDGLLSATGITDDEREEKLKEVFARAQSLDGGLRPASSSGNEGAAAPGSSAKPIRLPGSKASSTRSIPFTGGDSGPNGSESATGPVPYTAYHGPGFGDPRELGLMECVDAIVAVVAVEGPVKASRAYRIITQLSGTRLREAALSALVQATKYAVRRGILEAEGQRGRGGFPGATLRIADQPAWILRQRGERGIDEIPDREIVAAANLVQVTEPTVNLDVLAKKTSLLFGYEKTTSHFKECLIEALGKHAK